MLVQIIYKSFNLRVSKNFLLWFYCISITLFFVWLQLDKYTTSYLKEGFFVSIDEIYYTNISDRRLIILQQTISGELTDLNLNLFPFLSNYLVSKLGKIYLVILNLTALFLLAYIIIKSTIDFKWKLFLLCNPVIPYVASSYLRDIYVYLLIVIILNAKSKLNLANTFVSFILLLLRPATLLLVLGYHSYRKSKVLYFFYLIITVFSVVLVLDLYNKQVDVLETLKRFGQIFGVDFLSKSTSIAFAQYVDVASSIYCLAFWSFLVLYQLGSKSYKIHLSKYIYILPMLFLYSLLYGSYLGFFVARTLYPVLIVLAYYLPSRKVLK